MKQTALLKFSTFPRVWPSLFGVSVSPEEFRMLVFFWRCCNLRYPWFDCGFCSYV